MHAHMYEIKFQSSQFFKNLNIRSLQGRSKYLVPFAHKAAKVAILVGVGIVLDKIYLKQSRIGRRIE